MQAAGTPNNEKIKSIVLGTPRRWQTIMEQNQTLQMRPYRDDHDFWRMRDFLREVFLLNDRLERSWSLPRLDYWRWHLIKTVGTHPMEQVTFLWESTDGSLGATLYTINSEAYLAVHPRMRSAELENEIFACAEQNLCRINPADQRTLFVLADEDDPLRKEVLQSRGYTFRDRPVYRWRRNLAGSIPSMKVAPGYSIRAMGDAREYRSRAWASFQAFHPDESDDAFVGGDWLANLQSAPLYRRDLDIVAEAPNGEIAAFSTIWYDDFTRSAVCVLVGTVPKHQRLGLGKAVITEGLRRLQNMGGTRVFANGFDPPANALYGSVLGLYCRAESWFKDLGQ
jgi:mycothiol synthase